VWQVLRDYIMNWTVIASMMAAISLPLIAATVIMSEVGFRHGKSELQRGIEVGEESIVFVLSRHGSRNMRTYDFRPYLSHILLDRLSAGSEAARILTLAPEEQKDAITKVFGKAPSTLTTNGAACEEKAGEAIAGLLGHGKAYAYADDDQRDVESATAFAKGATRRGVSTGTKPDTSERYMLAEGSDAKIREGCARANLAETLRATGYADLEALERAAPKKQVEFLEARGFQFPGAMKSAEDEHGQLPFYANVEGPLRATCMVAQHFVCERAAGVSEPSFAAIGVQETDLVWLYEACDFVFGLYRNSVNKERFGMEFNVALAAAMDAASKGMIKRHRYPTMPLVKHSPSTGLVLYEAHDCNVDWLRQTLGLEWDLPRIAPKNSVPFSTKIILVQNTHSANVEAYLYAIPLEAMADGCRAMNASHAFTKLASLPYDKARAALLGDVKKSTCLPEDIRMWH
jgi:hypothetical protein